MRRFIHNRAVHFRSEAELFERAANAAQREGLSVSAYIRHALRRAVQEAA